MHDDATRAGAGCALFLAALSTALFLWKWWEAGQAEAMGRPLHLHVFVRPVYGWLGRPGILLCGGLTTLVFAAIAIADFTTARRHAAGHDDPPPP